MGDDVKLGLKLAVDLDELQELQEVLDKLESYKKKINETTASVSQALKKSSDEWTNQGAAQSNVLKALSKQYKDYGNLIKTKIVQENEKAIQTYIDAKGVVRTVTVAFNKQNEVLTKVSSATYDAENATKRMGVTYRSVTSSVDEMTKAYKRSVKTMSGDIKNVSDLLTKPVTAEFGDVKKVTAQYKELENGWVQLTQTVDRASGSQVKWVYNVNVSKQKAVELSRIVRTLNKDYEENVRKYQEVERVLSKSITTSKDLLTKPIVDEFQNVDKVIGSYKRINDEWYKVNQTLQLADGTQVKWTHDVNLTTGQVMECSRAVSELSRKVDETQKKWNRIENPFGTSFDPSVNPLLSKSTLGHDIERVQKARNIIDEGGILKGTQLLSDMKKGITEVGFEFNKVTGEMLVTTPKTTLQMENLNKATLSWGEALDIALERIVQWGIATALIYGTKRAIQTAYRELIKIEQAAIGVRKVLPTDTDFKGLEKGAIVLAKNFGRGITETYESMQSWARQYKSVNDIVAMTNASMLAAVATDIEMAESVKNLSAIMAEFEYHTGKAVHVVDVLNELSNNFRTTASETSAGLVRMGSAAHTLGMDLEMAASLVAVGIESLGATGEQMGTALKTAFARMTNKDAIEALAEMGIEFTNLQQAILDIGVSWDDMSKAEQLALTKSLGGTHHYVKLMGIFNNFDRVIEGMILSYNSLNSAADEAELGLASMEVKLGQMSASFQSLAVSVGNSGLFGAIKNLIDGWVIMINLLVKVNDYCRGLLVPILALAGAIALVYKNLAKLQLLMKSTGGKVGVVIAVLSTIALLIGTVANRSNDLSISITRLQAKYDELGKMDQSNTSLENLINLYENLNNKLNDYAKGSDQYVKIKSEMDKIEKVLAPHLEEANKQFGNQIAEVDGLIPKLKTLLGLKKDLAEAERELTLEAIESEIAKKQLEKDYYTNMISDLREMQGDRIIYNNLENRLKKISEELSALEDTKRNIIDRSIIPDGNKLLDGLDDSIDTIRFQLADYTEKVLREAKSAALDMQKKLEAAGIQLNIEPFDIVMLDENGKVVVDHLKQFDQVVLSYYTNIYKSIDDIKKQAADMDLTDELNKAMKGLNQKSLEAWRTSFDKVKDDFKDAQTAASKLFETLSERPKEAFKAWEDLASAIRGVTKEIALYEEIKAVKQAHPILAEAFGVPSLRQSLKADIDAYTNAVQELVKIKAEINLAYAEKGMLNPAELSALADSMESQLSSKRRWLTTDQIEELDNTLAKLRSGVALTKEELMSLIDPIFDTFANSLVTSKASLSALVDEYDIFINALTDGEKGIDKYITSLRNLYSYWDNFTHFSKMRDILTDKLWVEPKEFGLSYVDLLRKEVADAEAVYHDLENIYTSWANSVYESYKSNDEIIKSLNDVSGVLMGYYEVVNDAFEVNEEKIRNIFEDPAEAQEAIDKLKELLPLLNAFMGIEGGGFETGISAFTLFPFDPKLFDFSAKLSGYSDEIIEAINIIKNEVDFSLFGDIEAEYSQFLEQIWKQAEKVEKLRAELYATEQAYEAFNDIINSGEQYFDNQTAAVLDLVLALKKAQTEWGILQAQYSMYMDRNLLGETLQKDKMDELLQGAFGVFIPTTTVSALDATNAMMDAILNAMTSNVNALKDALSFVFEEADTELQDILSNIGEKMVEKIKAGDYAFDLTDLISETDNTKLNELMDNLSAKLEVRAAALKAQESLSEGDQQHLADLEKMISAIGSGDLYTAISMALKNFIEQREIYDDLVESQAELTDDTLKYNTLLKDIVDSTTALNSLYNQWKDKQEAITYDTLVMSGILRDLSLQPILFTDKRDTQDVLSDIKDIENAYRREGEQLANLLETERKWKDAHDKATAANDTDKLNELDKLRNKLYAGMDSADYKEALAEISKVIGLTDEELKQLTADISQQRIVLTDLSNEWDNLSEEYKSLVMMDNWADVMSKSMSRLQPMINETVSSVKDLVKASKDLIAEQNGLKWSNTLRDYVEDAATLAKDITSRLTGSVPQSIASIFAKDVKSQYESQYNDAYKTLTELAAKHTKANEGLIEQTRVREQLPREIADLRSQIDNIKYDIDQSKSLLDSKSSDISSKAEAQLKSMRTQLIELEAALKDANDQLVNAQNATKEYNAEIDNLEGTIANTTVQLSDLQAKYREIEQNEIFADKLSKSLDILIPKIKDVKDRIVSLIKTYRNLMADYSGLVWSDIAQDYIVNMTAQAENAAKALVGIVSTSLEAAVIPESYIESLESRYSAEITELAKLESEYTKAYEDLLTTQLLREKLLEKQADLAKNVSTLEMNLFTAMADDRGSEDLAKVIDQYIKELDEINELSAEAKAEIDSIDQSIEHLSYTVLVDLAITIGVVKQRMSELIDIFANTNSVKEFTEFIAASFKNIAPTITKTSDEIKQAIKSTYDVIYKQMGMTWSDGFQKYVRDSADIIAEEVKAAMPEVASSVNEALEKLTPSWQISAIDPLQRVKLLEYSIAQNEKSYKDMYDRLGEYRVELEKNIQLRLSAEEEKARLERLKATQKINLEETKTLFNKLTQNDLTSGLITEEDLTGLKAFISLEPQLAEWMITLDTTSESLGRIINLVKETHNIDLSGFKELFYTDKQFAVTLVNLLSQISDSEQQIMKTDNALTELDGTLVEVSNDATILGVKARALGVDLEDIVETVRNLNAELDKTKLQEEIWQHLQFLIGQQNEIWKSFMLGILSVGTDSERLLGSLVDRTDAFGNAMRDSSGKVLQMRDSLQAVNDIAKETTDLITNYIASSVGNFVETMAFTELSDSVEQGLLSLDASKFMASFAGGAATAIIRTIYSVFSTEDWSSALDNLIDGLLTGFSKFMDIIDRMIEHMPEMIGRILVRLPELLVRVFQSLIKALPSLLKSLPQILSSVLLGSAMKGVLNAFIKLVTDNFSKIQDVLAPVWEGVASTVGLVMSKMWDYVKKALIWVAESVYGFLQTLWAIPGIGPFLAIGAGVGLTSYIYGLTRKTFNAGGSAGKDSKSSDSGGTTAYTAGTNRPITYNIYATAQSWAFMGNPEEARRFAKWIGQMIKEETERSSA